MKSEHETDEQRAERLGYDSAVNGANTVNCHFSLFNSPTMTAAWERGNKRGLAEKQGKER